MSAPNLGEIREVVRSEIERRLGPPMTDLMTMDERESLAEVVREVIREELGRTPPGGTMRSAAQGELPLKREST